MKLFHEEAGSDMVDSLVSDPSNHVWLLSLSRLEFMSALHRRYRNGELVDQQLQIALEAFDRQLRLFNEQPLGSSVLYEAQSLMAQWGKTHGLRTLDALQLGAFSLLQEKDWGFICSDTKLAAIARKAGFKVVEPTD